MEVEITSKYENKLLNRTEVRFKATHGKENTPTRDAIRDALAKSLGGGKDAVVVEEMQSAFGKAETTGYAKMYANLEAAKKLEQHHIQLRNKLPGVSKKEKKVVAAAPAKKRGR